MATATFAAVGAYTVGGEGTADQMRHDWGEDVARGTQSKTAENNKVLQLEPYN